MLIQLYDKNWRAQEFPSEVELYFFLGRVSRSGNMQSVHIVIYVFFNPRLTGGGGVWRPPPLPNIRDSSKTNGAIDVKLGRPSHTTIWHRPWFFFLNPPEIFEIWSILWRHYTPLLVENWPNFAGLWKTQFLMKTQMESTKRRKMRSSTRWLSLFFKILGFWPLKCQKIDFFGKWSLKSKIFKIFKKP